MAVHRQVRVMAGYRISYMNYGLTFQFSIIPSFFIEFVCIDNSITEQCQESQKIAWFRFKMLYIFTM